MVYGQMSVPEKIYWWDKHAPNYGGHQDLAEQTDLLIIGAGYTGLTAAITAQDAGASTVVLDAGIPGAGASSRNGGVFGGPPKIEYAQLVKKFGFHTANGIMAENKIALDFVRDLQIREGIDCDFQQSGRLTLAWTRGDFDRLKHQAELLHHKCGYEPKIIEKSDLHAEIKTDRYHGGMVLPEFGAINPAKFHKGLMQAVRKRDVPILANCPVTNLSQSTGSWVAQTPIGSIKAKKVILATNGYTDALVPHANRRVFPLPSFIIATEELPAELLTRLAPTNRMMVETRARYSYFRLSPDGKRILWGARAAMTFKPLQGIAEQIRRIMADIWPETQHVALSHVWTGKTGYTFNQMPQVGEIGGLHFALGMSGSGTVQAPYLGSKVAWRALGDPRGETAYAHTKLATSAMYWGGYPLFLEAAERWYSLVVDTTQNLRARL